MSHRAFMSLLIILLCGLVGVARFTLPDQSAGSAESSNTQLPAQDLDNPGTFTPVSTSAAGQGYPVESQPGGFSPLGQDDPGVLQDAPDAGYTEEMHCDETQDSITGPIEGYCGGPIGDASCIETGSTYTGGTNYRCKPGYPVWGASGSSPDEATISNDPGAIYSESVTCKDSLDVFDPAYGACDLPTYGPNAGQCIEDPSAWSFGRETHLLCKP